MLDPDLGASDSKEALKESIEAFTKIKSNLLDRILERTAIVNEIDFKEIAKEEKISDELAKVIYVLESDFNIPRKLAVDFFNYEEKRLDEVNYEVPDIYSFRIRFAMEEGFWIKYTTNDFPKKIRQKVGKLIALDRSLFGDLAGDKEDSALYIIERSYIINETIKPVVVSWTREHQNSNYFDAVKKIVCGMLKKSMKEAEAIIDEIYERLRTNMDSLKFIISELKTKGWAIKAISEFEEINQGLETGEMEKSQMNLRIACELILENRLIMEYNSLAIETEINQQITRIIDTEKGNEVDRAFEKDGIITDKIALTITNIEDLPNEKVRPIIKDLIKENFESAMKVHQQKPTIFAKEFVKRIMEELNITQGKINKNLKKFDIKIMNRLSPIGNKEFPNMSVDEKILLLIEEELMEIIQQKVELEEERKLVKEKTFVPKLEGSKDTIEKAETSNKEKTLLRSKILESSEKELWIIIRDEYLKELFDNSEELLAGANVLKKYLLELGLLLTETEAKITITQDLQRKGLKPGEVNKEELDKAICKIILTQVKERIESS